MASSPAPEQIALAAASWWEEMNNSSAWQDGIFHSLGFLYGLIASIAFIQLVRIECNVPEFGWTTQKVFQLLNFLVNGIRCAVFGFHRHLQEVKPEIFQHVLLDFPGLLFFTTYGLLALFWAEIYYQARSLPTDRLRKSFYIINGVMYTIQSVLWLLLCWNPVQAMVVLSKIFSAGVSLLVALGFLVYGGRLYLMLKNFPIESKGRNKKLREVGKVASVCFSCFSLRCIMMCSNAFNKAADLDVLNHPILNFLFYLLVEILPSSLVLYILRKIPRKQQIPAYDAISCSPKY